MFGNPGSGRGPGQRSFANRFRPPITRVRLNNGQSIPSTTFGSGGTTVNWDTIELDEVGAFLSSGPLLGSAYLATPPGYNKIRFQGYNTWDNRLNSNGIRWMWLWFNNQGGGW